MIDPSLHQKKLRGLNTAWWQSGINASTSPIAFLIHGFPDSPSTWNKQLSLLESRFEVVRPFLRGLGASEGTEEISRYQRASVLLDHLEILREVDPSGTRPVVVFGHDIGCIAAWELARALGERASHVVLIAGMGLEMFWNRRQNLKQHWKSWYMYWMQLPELPELFFKWYGPWILRRAYLAGGIEGDDPNVEEMQREVLPYLGTFFRHYRAGRNDLFSLKASASRLRSPLLVLWGDRDPFLCNISADEFRPFAANCELRVLNAGHWLQKERYEEVNQLVGAFLS